MDGVNWTHDTAKERIKAGELMEDFVQHTGANNEISDGREIITIVESKRMKGFEALKMSDGNYFPMPRMVGGCHYPVVFNNACSSWRGQSMEFGCNGASIYIGTATDVLNPVAGDSRLLIRQGDYFWKIDRHCLIPITKEIYRTIWIHSLLDARLSVHQPSESNDSSKSSASCRKTSFSD